MKKIFALFCALCLMPTFSAQAWIGGPFSNNTFFSPAGTDGVYEATGTAYNGIGLYRFAVGNEFPGVNPQGVQATVPSQIPNGTIGIPITVPGINSGNVVIGAFGNAFTNIWYYRGVQYFGTTIGTVNAVAGKVIGLSFGRNNNGVGTVTLTSAFKANLVTNEFIAATPFQGVGNARVSNGLRFRFTVLGSKVSNNLTFGL